MFMENRYIEKTIIVNDCKQNNPNEKVNQSAIAPNHIRWKLVQKSNRFCK